VTAVTTLTPRLVEDFRRDGFVVVPDLLSAAELVHFGAAVDEGVARRSRHDTRTLAEKSRYEQSFTQCQNLWEDCPEVRPLTFHPVIAEAAARLLGVAAIRIWHDQALYKEAGARETGAMGYLPGSHRLGVRAFVDIFSGQGEDPLTRNELQAIAPVFVEVPAGSVAFHHGLTFHLAGPNLTGTVRRVHTAIYFADGSTRGGGYYPHPAVERAGIAMGAVIASDVTPLAWPLPDGMLPDPPEEPMA